MESEQRGGNRTRSGFFVRDYRRSNMSCKQVEVAHSKLCQDTTTALRELDAIELNSRGKDQIKVTLADLLVGPSGTLAAEVPADLSATRCVCCRLADVSCNTHLALPSSRRPCSWDRPNVLRGL